MPYYTRSSGRKSVSSDAAPSTPIRRASSSKAVEVPPVVASPPSPTRTANGPHPLLRDLPIPISPEDARNEILMAVVSILAEQKEPKPLTTYDFARLTPHKANALSTCIRAHLRRDLPYHLLVRHDPVGESKIPAYSLNIPGSTPAQARAAPLAHEQTAAEADMELDLRDDFEVDVDIEGDAVKMEEPDDTFEAFSSPAGSASPVITPPPPLSSSIPRLRSHFVENLAMPSRGISPDATSDGSSPPSTPLSPPSPLVPAVVPLSPTTGILSQGFKAMLLQEPAKSTLDSYASSPVLDVNAGFFPTMTMVGHPYQPQIAQEDYISYKQSVMMNVQAYPQPAAPTTETTWDSGDDWMMGPESMPLDELDRELSEAWH